MMQLVGFFSQWVGNGIISYYLARILSSVGKHTQGSLDVVSEGMLTKIHWTSRCQQLDAAGRSQWRSSSLVSRAGSLLQYMPYLDVRSDIGTGSGLLAPRSSVKGSEGDLSG